MNLLDALFASLCLAFTAVFASQTLHGAGEAELLARAAALAQELASACALHVPAEAELPRQGQPCLGIPLAALRAEGLLSPGFPEAGPFGLRWQALICQPRAEAGGTAGTDSADGASSEGGGTGTLDPAPLALACLVLPGAPAQSPRQDLSGGGTGNPSPAGASGQTDAAAEAGQPVPAEGQTQTGAGQADAGQARAFCHSLAERLPGVFVLAGAARAQGCGQSFSLDLEGMGAGPLAASQAGAGLAVQAFAAARSRAAARRTGAFLRREPDPAFPEGGAMAAPLDLGGHSLVKAQALQFAPPQDAPGAEQAGNHAGPADSAGSSAEAGAAGGGAVLERIGQSCGGSGAGGLLAFDPDQGLLLCTRGQPVLIHDAGNSLAFAYIGFDEPSTGANRDALCPRGTQAEHFSISATFEAEDSSPDFTQLQRDLASGCGPSSRYGMADYFCGQAPAGRTLRIWQAFARKRVWWDEEEEFASLFGGFFGEAAEPWSRARLDRELCQACRGGGFASRQVSPAAGGDPAGSGPARLHAYLGREDMMPVSTVGGVPAASGTVHFTACRPRRQ